MISRKAVIEIYRKAEVLHYVMTSSVDTRKTQYLHQTGYYNALVGETEDKYDVDIVSILIRYLKNLCACEEVIGVNYHRDRILAAMNTMNYLYDKLSVHHPALPNEIVKISQVLKVSKSTDGIYKTYIEDISGNISYRTYPSFYTTPYIFKWYNERI